MRNPLVTCPSCDRHVRKCETTCPFCRRPVPADLVPVPQGPRRQHLGKATMYLASALTVSGCGARTEPLTPSDGGDAGADTAVDGQLDSRSEVTIDSAVVLDTATALDAPDDEGSSVPIYK